MTIFRRFYIAFIAIGSVALTAVGCAGPVIHHGSIYMGRTVLVHPISDSAPPPGIPIKEALTYSVRQYIVEETCDQVASTTCQVIEQDAGRMMLAAPDRFLAIQYRGNLISNADLAIELNSNSTLRTLSIAEQNESYSLFFHFGDQGTGVK